MDGVFVMGPARLARQLAICGLQFLVCQLSTIAVHAQSASTDDAGRDKQRTASALSQTMGGQQFWTDVRLFRLWRIQRNVLTGHCRLLDERCRRWESGSLEACEERLKAVRGEMGLAPMRGTAVILIHGLADTRWVMSKADDYFKESGRYDHVFNLTYASTREDVADHSAALAQVIANLEGVNRIDLVGFSLGAIVIRHYFGREGEPSPDPRIGRTVMWGPPNKGAHLAARLGKHNKLFGWIAGKSGMALGLQWAALLPQLANPTGEFGIIAGGVQHRGIDNPMIAGDDDMIVSVKETLLSGASDFLLVPFIHNEIPRKEIVWKSTLRFLQHGYFKSATSRRPIVKRPVTETLKTTNDPDQP